MLGQLVLFPKLLYRICETTNGVSHFSCAMEKWKFYQNINNSISIYPFPPLKTCFSYSFPTSIARKGFGKVMECHEEPKETALTLCRSNIKFLPAYLVLSSSSINLIEVKKFSISCQISIHLRCRLPTFSFNLKYKGPSDVEL